MARAQLSSQSMGVLRFGPCGMTLPSGPIAGSRSGRETLVSAAVAPGGGSSPPLRPQPARPSAATSAPIAAIRARRRSDEELNSVLLNRRHHSRSDASGDSVAKLPHSGAEQGVYQRPFAKALSHLFACRRTFFGAVPPWLARLFTESSTVSTANTSLVM